MFKKKKKDEFHLPSNMDMKILQNEDLCYFKNSGIDQCCVIVQFLSSLSVSTDYLCVLSCDFMFPVSDAVCSLSCTLIKDVDFVSGRPGFQIPTPSFLGLMFV